MKTLQQYYTQASDRPLAFSEDRLRAMLSSVDAAPTHFPVYDPSVGSRALRVTGVGLAIAALCTLAFEPSGISNAVLNKDSRLPASVASNPRGAPSNSQSASQLASTSTSQSPAMSQSASQVTRLQTNRLSVPETSIARKLDVTSATVQSIASSYAPQFAPLAVTGTYLSDAVTLSETEALALGIRRLADGSSGYAYNLVANLPSGVVFTEQMLRDRGYEDSLLVQTIDRSGVGHRFMSRADFPLSVVTRRMSSIGHSWQIITDDAGRLLDERVSVKDDNQIRYISGLFTRGLDGDVARSVESVRGLEAIAQSLRLNTLLPIRVNTSDASNGVFWCRPDPALIAALPARTVAQLRRELEKAVGAVVTRDTLAIVRRGWALTVLATIDSIMPGTLKVETDMDVAPQGMTGAEIFAGSLRIAGAVVRFEPATNPASGSTALNIELTQPRRVTVTLHDVNGRKVKVLASTRALDEGVGEIIASLDGVAKGLYLVAISTDRKEQVVQRLVVE